MKTNFVFELGIVFFFLQHCLFDLNNCQLGYVGIPQIAHVQSVPGQEAVPLHYSLAPPGV